MVQLNTTYDSSIHQKVFVLKGDEAYARTTDTIATLITDFGDFDNHISYCHIGLEIQVLRELGDSHLLITIDGESLEPIPWSDSGMAEIIDSDWNEKGVYWENGKLLIGKYSLNPLINTGLYLLYDVEHKIEVRYEPNNYCLGSSAKPIVFTVPTPDVFTSTLTLNPLTTRFAPDDEVDMKLSFDCDNQTTTAKSVRIYDNDVLVETVEVTQDIFTMLELGVLSTGLHTIKAVFEGDDEAYASETSLDISVGYKITNVEYPSYIIQGNTGTLSCNVLDYFNEPYVDLGVSVAEYNDGGWESISSQSTTDGYGFVSINPVNYSEKEFAITDGNWYSERHTTNIINPTSISLELDKSITMEHESNRVSGTLLSNNQPITVKGVAISLTLSNFYDSTSNTVYTNDNGGFSLNMDGEILNGVHRVDTLARIGSRWSKVVWRRLSHWWSSSDNKYNGNSTNTYATIVKKSNGFGLVNSSSNWGNVSFLLSERNTVEFTVVDKRSGTSKLMGRTFNELGINNGDVISILIYDSDGIHVQLIKNSSTIYEYISYPKFGVEFDIAPNDEIIIDNLKIEKA